MLTKERAEIKVITIPEVRVMDVIYWNECRGAFPLFSHIFLCTPTSVQCFVQLIRPAHPDVCQECEKGFGEIQSKANSRKATCMLFAVKHGDCSLIQVISKRHFLLWSNNSSPYLAVIHSWLTGFRFFYPIKTVTAPHIQQRENMCANRTSVLGAETSFQTIRLQHGAKLISHFKDFARNWRVIWYSVKVL